MVSGVTLVRRESFVVFLVLLHLVVAPCATAMALMPAEEDCQHCHALDGSDICLEATEVTTSVIKGLAFDSGRADPPLPSATLAVFPATKLLALNPEAAAFRAWSRGLATRHTGDPPLYLRFSQLLN